MRHRAVLFGLLGLFFIYAAFYPAYQPLAFVGGLGGLGGAGGCRSAGLFSLVLRSVAEPEKLPLVSALKACVLSGTLVGRMGFISQPLRSLICSKSLP